MKRRVAITMVLAITATAAALGGAAPSGSATWVGVATSPGSATRPSVATPSVIAAWPVIAAAPDQPLMSALVTVAGPSVSDQLMALGGPVLDPAQAAALAASAGDALAAAEASVARWQAPVVAAAERRGVRIVSRYTTSANGLLVHATSAQLADLARVPGVLVVEPAPRARPSLARSVPHIGADQLAAQLGLDGEGVVVAVVDSGIDYTHADFGGPGSSEAYDAAVTAAETITDTWQGELLFPTAKVVGGWDFVGPNYSSPAACRPADEAAGKCTTTPHPDPDPLDQMGHGTSVAGIIAGQGAGEVYHGVAPGALLVALKVYGPPARGVGVDEAADVVLDAIEWCTRVNLNLPVPGTAPARVDVINMSLGESYAQGSRLFDRAVEAAVNAGIVVVASAGNDSNRPFVVNAPSASPLVLSVAGSLPPGGSEPADEVWSGSARGPSKNGALKPDITAPASGIMSAAMATGAGASAVSGTSAASPFVAGAAALIRQRSISETLGLGALDLAALLMNHAEPVVAESVGGTLRPVAVARQGAGRVQVWDAGRSKLLVRTGDIASVNVGPLSLYGADHYERRLTVRNLSDEPLRFELDARFATEADAGRGVTITSPASSGPMTLPGRGLAEVPVGFEVDPARMAAWPLGGTFAPGAGVLDDLELDGWLELTIVDDDGQPLDEPAAHVPFYVLPRAASRVRLAGFEVPRDGGDGSLRLANDGPTAGAAELLVLPAGAEAADPDESAVSGEIDVRRLGVRMTSLAPDRPDEWQLTFGIGLYEVAAVPFVSSFEVYLDTDRDGRADWRIRTGPERTITGQGSTERMVVTAGTWDVGSGTVGGEQVVADMVIDLHTRLAMFSLPAVVVGLPAPAPFGFFLVSRGLTEDWLHVPTTDLVPDGAVPAAGPWYSFEPARMAYEPRSWSLDVTGGTTTAVGLVPGPGDWQYSLLALYPDNQFEWRDGQVAVLAPGSGPAPPPGPGPVYLPITLRGHNIYVVPPPNVMIREAFNALAGVERLRMTYDLTDNLDPPRSANRDYLFDGTDRMWVIASIRAGPRDGQRDEFIRWLNQGYSKPWGGIWQCWHVDEHMLLWPEMVDRLRREFPATNWEFRDPARGRYNDRDVWMLQRAVPGGEFLIYVDIEYGWPLLLSRGEPDFLAPLRRHIYRPRDFNDPTAKTGRPRGVKCP